MNKCANVSTTSFWRRKGKISGNWATTLICDFEETQKSYFDELLAGKDQTFNQQNTVNYENEAWTMNSFGISLIIVCM